MRLTKNYHINEFPKVFLLLYDQKLKQRKVNSSEYLYCLTKQFYTTEITCNGF